MCSRCRRCIREQGGSDTPLHDNMESHVPRYMWVKRILRQWCMTGQTAKLKNSTVKIKSPLICIKLTKIE